MKHREFIYYDKVILTAFNARAQALRLVRYRNTIYPHKDWTRIEEADVRKSPELRLLWSYAKSKGMEIYRTFMDENIYYVKKVDNATFYNGFKVVIKPRRSVPDKLIERLERTMLDKYYSYKMLQLKHVAEPDIFEENISTKIENEKLYWIMAKLVKSVGYFDVQFSIHSNNYLKLQVSTSLETVVAAIKINPKRNSYGKSNQT